MFARAFLFLFCTLMASKIWAEFKIVRSPIATDCKPGEAQRNKWLGHAINQSLFIFRNASRKDVRVDIQALENLMRICQFTDQDVRSTTIQRQNWKAQGIQVERARIRPEIERGAQFGPVSWEVQRYRSLGPVDRATETWLRSMEARGEASAQREQATCGKPVNNIAPKLGPVRNQDGVGWCFGYTAADLLSFKTGKRISAMDVSLNYYIGKNWAITRWLRGEKTSSYSGGFIKEALERSINKGLCEESRFRSDDNGFSNNVQKLDNIQKIKDSWKTPLCQRSLQTVRNLFPSMNMTQLADAVSSSTQTSFINRLATISCGNRIPASNFQVYSKSGSTVAERDQLLREADAQLSRGNPVGIAINSGIVSDFNARASSPDHAVMIVGREYDPAKRACVYLIRNSYGPICTQIPIRCQNAPPGHFWVSREELSRSIGTLTYVQ